MVPRVNSQGYSFKGVIAYLMHDKDRAKTSERVNWFETGNLMTNDPFKAALVMAWTDKNAEHLKENKTGRKVETGAVYHYSLSWAIGESPSIEHQKEQARATIECLGLEDNQYVLVAHNDTKHTHIHVVVNLTHPETGKRTEIGLDQRKLQKWALGYEREHGVHCHAREDNAKTYETTGQSTKYRDKKQDYSVKVTRAFQLSDNGKSFVHALREEGLQLAPSKRGEGFVIVDEKGDVQKLTRQLNPIDKHQKPITGKEKGALIRQRLKDVDRSTLPDADTLSKQIKEKLEATRAREEEKTAQASEVEKNLSGEFSEQAKAKDPHEKDAYVYDRDRQETARQVALEEAAHKAGEEKAHKQVQERTQSKALDALRQKKRQAEQRAQKALNKEKFTAYEKKLEKRVQERRTYWQIPRLEKEKQQAETQLKARFGWFYRTIRRSQYREAKDNVQAKGKNLAHAQEKWKTDIKAIYAKRPQWVIDRELKKRGFETEPVKDTKTARNDNHPSTEKPPPQKQKTASRDVHNANDNQKAQDIPKEPPKENKPPENVFKLDIESKEGRELWDTHQSNAQSRERQNHRQDGLEL